MYFQYRFPLQHLHSRYFLSARKSNITKKILVFITSYFGWKFYFFDEKFFDLIKNFKFDYLSCNTKRINIYFIYNILLIKYKQENESIWKNKSKKDVFATYSKFHFWIINISWRVIEFIYTSLYYRYFCCIYIYNLYQYHDLLLFRYQAFSRFVDISTYSNKRIY